MFLMDRDGLRLVWLRLPPARAFAVLVVMRLGPVEALRLRGVDGQRRRLDRPVE